MEKFIFNDISSDELGLIIKEMPPITKAAKNIETIKVNGRNGNLHIDNGTYDSVDITIECIVKDLTKIDMIKSVLEGTGSLKLSTVPNRTFTATIKNQIDFSKYLTVLREFPLILELEPFSYSDSKELNYSESATFIIDGNVKTNPIISVTGIGVLTINNISIEVLETDITIDCDLMNCTNNGIDKNNMVILDDFPHLNPGENNLTLGTGITNVKIEYAERWL